MSTRLIVREAGGAVQVFLSQPNVVVQEAAGPPERFESPLSPQEMEDLRWYLEDYLQAPYAVYEDRGSAIGGRIPVWGMRLFDSLFGPGMAGRDVYQRARQSGEWSLWLVSDSPEFLSLPWEMMRDGRGAEALSLGVPVSRTVDLDVAPAAVGGEELRVLMVIARPEGERDAGYRAVARSLVERLPAVSGRVTLDVVRPPTLDELRRRLEQARAEGRPYQVVHFDGHGTFGSGAGGGALGDLQFGAAPRGYLVFEKETGGAEHVAAEDFGAVLRGADVPLLVFNACQSAAVAGGGSAEAAVAVRVLHAGAAAVVAMSYSVYVVAAAEFMAAFYEALFGGATVESAVGAGRRQLRRAHRRPSPRGPLPLEDWMVPVHYARGEVRFPQLVQAPRGDLPSLGRLLERMRLGAHPGGAAEAGVHAEGSLAAAAGVFVGRDREFVRLEAALRHRRVVVLHGLGGTGKTEVAKAFARWMRETGGVDDPGWVFFHSFEPGIASFGLGGVVTSIGLRLFGPDFVLRFPATEKRAAAILAVMREHRMLLVWDNFETVSSMPDPTGTTPPLDEARRAEVRGFLAEVARSARGGVIVTSRSREEWLGEVHRMEVGGLDRGDAVQYADVLLAPHAGARGRREERAFEELLEALGGHPLSMRLTLPHLERVDAAVLLRSLREAPQEEGVWRDADGADRQGTLDACIHYSFQHLPAEDVRLLPALTLFEGTCDANVLRLMGEEAAAPERFRGVAREEWVAALEHCVEVGLLTTAGGGMYRIHPALPPYLDGLWRGMAGGAYAAEVVAASTAVTTAFAALGGWALGQVEGGRAEVALAVVRHHQRTMGRMVLWALESGAFAAVHAILQPLLEMLTAKGGMMELLAWTNRCRSAVEGPLGEVPDLGSDAGVLWLFVVGRAAHALAQAGDLAQAETMYREIEALLADSQEPATRRHLAAFYHQLGNVAQRRGDLAEAGAWSRKSLAIEEDRRDRHGMALSYYNLGVVALSSGHLAEAEEWGRKAMAILEDMENRTGMAGSYDLLGTVARLHGHLPEAEEWYRKSLEIREAIRDRPGIASSYHNLGVVAQLREHLSEAEAWYQKSLAIREAVGDRPGVASSYHQLGMVAEYRKDPAQAEEWYRKSLEMKEYLGDRPGLAMTYGRLGLLEEARGDTGAALQCMVRCVVLFQDFPHPSTGPAPRHLARLTGILGFPALEAAWTRVTGAALSEKVRAQVLTLINQLEPTDAAHAVDP